MKEKVHTIHQIWDMTIIDGVADYKGQPHQFFSLEPDKGEPGFFSDRYELIPLTAEIFTLVMQGWQYWLHWLEMNKKGIHIPHSRKYAEMRKELSYNQIVVEEPFTQVEKEKAEDNYQRKLIVEKYIKDTKCIPFQIRAEFIGTTDGTSKTEDLFVEWTDLLDKKI